MSTATLDSLPLTLTAYSGFTYPQNAQLVTLLGDGSSTGGNAVLQSSALTLRQATVSCVCQGVDDVDAIRALYETKESVVFVDEDGQSKGVRVLEFSAAAHGGDVWDFTLTLVEDGETEGSGS